MGTMIAMDDIQEGDFSKPETVAEDLHCTICQKRIDPKRATRQTATCSEKCKNRLDTIRAKQRADRKCPHCLHPSSPVERAQYRQWRVDRGDRKEVAPLQRDTTLASKQLLREALQSSLKHLEGYHDSLQVGAEGAEDFERRKREAKRVNELIQKIRFLIEKRPA